MNTTKSKIWFPSKTYGLGWGPPVCWQGWIVLLAYFGILAGGAFTLLSEPKDSPLFVLFALGLTMILIFVCWLKGEKLAWRWGKQKEHGKS